MTSDPFEIPVRKTVNKVRLALKIGVPLLIIMGLIAFVLKVMATALEMHERVHCAADLRQIGFGLQLYASNYQGQFPRGLYDPATADKPTAYTHADDNAGELFAGNNPPINDVTVTFFVMLKTGDLTPGVYICPLSGKEVWQTPPQGIDSFSNIPSANYLAYSINNPYLKSDDPAARDAWALQYTSPSHLTVVAADMNPGTPELLTLTPQSTPRQMKKGNSRNHGGDGQNVLFNDGHVEWLTTPFYDEQSPSAGPISPTADNIYTYGTGDSLGIIGSSTGGDDAILLPTEGMR